MFSSRDTHARNSFRLLTFGGLSLVAPAGSVVRQQRRRLALLVLLATGGKRGVSRDKLLLWLSPESTTESARHSLHQLLYYLRQQAGESAFIGSDPLSLNPEVFSSDFWDFERAVERESYAEAVDLYKGPFLDGFHLPDSADFDQWAAAERSRLSSVYCELLVRLGADATSRNNHVAAIKWSRQLADQDPLSGRAAIALMRSLEAAGDGPAAVLHARRHESLVRAELGTGPDPELMAFVERHRMATRTPPGLRNGDFHSIGEIQEVTAAGKPVVIESAWHHRRGRRAIQWVAACLFVVLAAGFALVRGNDLTGEDQILVADFTSQPIDSISARALSEVLRSSLVDSRSANVVPRAELDRALESMQLPITSRLDSHVARDIAIRNGYEAVLGGSITKIGTGYVVSAQLTTTRGRELATLTETAIFDDALIPAFGRLAISLRRKMGEAASSLDSVPSLADVTTRSLLALRRYTQAQQEDRTGRGQAQWTITLLREAIAADSTFASAHRLLGIKLYNLRATRESIRELRAAERFSDRLTDVERLQALSGLHLVLRDYSRAADEAEQVLKLRPRMLWAFNQVAILDNLLGRYEHSREIAKRRQQVDSTGFSLGPAAAIYQGRITEGVGMARAVFIRNGDLKRTLLLGSGRRSMAFVHGAAADYDSVEYYSAPIGGTLRGDPEVLARSQLARGQMARAFATLGVRARSADGDPPSSRFAATNEALAASVTVVMLGDQPSASRRLDAVLADTAFHKGDPANQPIDVVVALALAGRARDARAELTRIERASDADLRTAREPELLVARGAVALAERRFPEAIAALQNASSSIMLGVHACRVCVLPLLGRAYEAAGQPDSARAVYERFLSTGDPDRIFPDGIWRAKVLVRLGGLHARRGDRTRAAARFAQFMTLWKDADPELRPQVDDARRRIVELRGSAGFH